MRQGTANQAGLEGQAHASTRADALAAVHSGRTHRRDGYCQVPVGFFVERIDVNMPEIPPIDLFEFPSDAREPALLRDKADPVSPLSLSLREHVWVRDEDYAHVRDYAESLLTSPRLTASMPPEKRMETLRRSAILVVEDLFSNPSEENIKRGIKVVSSFVHVMMKEPSSYIFLSQLSSHDPYTLQHSVGTASNCIVLARKAGVSRESELLEVGMAGLLHDIGKVKVRTEVINKPGPLDEIEWEEMRKHSEEGYDLIRDQNHITERTKRAILEHHEDKTGKGYPRGLREDQVDLFSKIVALCDTFNALTTNRSYSNARSPFDAFQLIREKLMHKTNDQLFKELVMVYGGKI